MNAKRPPDRDDGKEAKRHLLKPATPATKVAGTERSDTPHSRTERQGGGRERLFVLGRAPEPPQKGAPQKAAPPAADSRKPPQE